MDVKPKIMDLYKIWTTTTAKAKKAGQNLFSNVCLKANNNNNNREREKIDG